MDVDNLVLVMNHIIDNPESWDQREWHCGTTHCFAGHGQILSGKKADYRTAFWDARKFFDIDTSTAHWLFDSRRSLSELYVFVCTVALGGGYDADGYDNEGFSCSGFDREGFDREGFSHQGFNREGFNREGMKLSKIVIPPAA